MGACVGVEARACCGNIGNGFEFYDGHTIFTYQGIIQLPAGSAALIVTSDPTEMVIPKPLAKLVNKCNAIEEFRRLWKGIKDTMVNVDTSADVKDDGLEQVLLECSSPMAKHDIGLFLTAKGDVMDNRWFIFVDRQVNENYTPPESLVVVDQNCGGSRGDRTVTTRNIDPEKDFLVATPQGHEHDAEKGTHSA